MKWKLSPAVEFSQVKIGDQNYITLAYDDVKDTTIANSENFKNGLQGLKNTLEPLLKNGNESFDTSKVKVVVDGDDFKFLYDSTVGDIKNQVYSAELDEGAKAYISDIEVEFDPGTTNIKGFKYTNAEGKKDIPVTVTANGNAYNEVKYDAAMRQYELEKIEYDRRQNEFNKQTSIYQRQDKQLELKLTRLDNERNALNTEIDAVKKVIQDGTEKGFKTFSG